MGAATSIEWTDATWNPIRGCSRVSDGCRNCYAERMAARFSKPGQPYHGVARDGKWTGEVRLVEERLGDPLRWRKPRRIFVNSMSDLFHEGVDNWWVERVFAVMAMTPHHTYQILTKRPAIMREMIEAVREELPNNADFFEDADSVNSMLSPENLEWPLPNVWLGVSVEDQASADERIPLLLDTPAAVRFLSCEPLLGPVDLDRRGELYPWRCSGCGQWWSYEPTYCQNCSGHGVTKELPKIDWVIVGGESGPGARPMHPDWARSLRDQCKAAGIPFFFKQWGQYIRGDMSGNNPYFGSFITPKKYYGCGKKAAGCLLDGREWKEFPE